MKKFVLQTAKFIEDEPSQDCILQEVSIYWDLTSPISKYQLNEKLSVLFGLHSHFLTAHKVTLYFKGNPSSLSGWFVKNALDKE